MKSNLVRIYNSHYHHHAEDQQSLEFIRNAMKLPRNQQFERSYITPTVTYVEKPKRVQLNPLVSGQLNRFQNFI